MNHEIVREALFYDGVEVEIRTAKDNSRNQIEDINYFIDRKVDLLIVAPNEGGCHSCCGEGIRAGNTCCGN